MARLNLVGSFLFLLASASYFAQVRVRVRVRVRVSPPLLLASAGYFAQTPPYEYLEPWEELVSIWAVRFPFAAGSACFVVAALLMLIESLSD